MNMRQPEWARQMTLELAHSPALWQELLRRHVPGPSGRCRACTRAGTGIPAAAWPCSLHALADQARALQDQDQDAALPQRTDR